MPLPSLPTKPADILDMNKAPVARARRTKATTASKATTAPVVSQATVSTENTVVETITTPVASKPAMKAKNAVIEKATAPVVSQAPAENTATQVTASPASTVKAENAVVETAMSPKKTRSRTKATATVSGAKTAVATKSATQSHKLFVLDTNVLLHDPTCLFRFEEHHIFIPMMTLEELDQHKKGLTEVARNAREVSRTLDALVADQDDLTQGIALNRLGNKEATGLLFFQTGKLDTDTSLQLPLGKADNLILNVVTALKKRYPEKSVILVSKDINMRLKAKALGLVAEDYLNDQVVEDSDLIYSGFQELPANFWQQHSKEMESWVQGGSTYYRIKGPLCASFFVNEFVYLPSDPPFYAQVKEASAKGAVLATIRDYTHKKNHVWGIMARNREQNFALNLLMNPDIDFVSLLGQAGTGKTLLALAAGLTQVLETKRYNEIIMTRATVSVGEDIGFLPGTEEEKMNPWMGALEDNLEFLNVGNRPEEPKLGWDKSASKEIIHAHIKVKSLNFMRGRTFLKRFLIIDEAQNLSPKQMKTLITRAGPGTKIVCLGNIAQIDTPYLTEGSSGLTFVVDRFKGWSHSGHVTLQKGERSRLADYASDILK